MIELSTTTTTTRVVKNEQSGNLATIVEIANTDSGDYISIGYFERIKTGVIRAGLGPEGSYWAEYEADDQTTFKAVETEHSCLDDALSAVELSIEQTNEDLANPSCRATGVPVKWAHDQTNL